MQGPMARFVKHLMILTLACLPFTYLYVTRMQALGYFDNEGFLYRVTVLSS